MHPTTDWGHYMTNPNTCLKSKSSNHIKSIQITIHLIIKSIPNYHTFKLFGSHQHAIIYNDPTTEPLDHPSTIHHATHAFCQLRTPNGIRFDTCKAEAVPRSLRSDPEIYLLGILRCLDSKNVPWEPTFPSFFEGLQPIFWGCKTFIFHKHFKF